MNVLQTDYSNLFAAGLRVIESRSTGRGSSQSQSHPVHAVPPTNLNSSASDREPEGEFAAPIEVSPKKTSRFSTKLWRRVSWRREKPSSADVVDGGAKPHPRTWRSMLPGCVGQEAALDARIWDWSTGVYRATTLGDEGVERADPYLDDKVDPVDTPLPTRTAFLVSLPSTAAPLWEHDFPVSLPNQHEQQRRRSLYMPPSLKETSAYQWELGSASSHEESGIDDDWHQFRVEWIDFGVDGSQ